VNRTRLVRPLAGLAVIALVAVACGGGATTPPPGTPTGETTAPDLAGQSVSVVAQWGSDTGEAANFGKILDAFEQQTGATTQYESPGQVDLSTFLGTRIQGGSPPDVAILPNPGLLVDFATQGQLKPIEDIAGSLVDQNFAPVWRDLATVDGTLYGVFFKGANKSTVWYNTNAFSQAGVEPPADWDGFLSVAQAIADSGVAAPIAMDAGSGWVLTDWFENVYIRTAGPDLYDQLTRHEIPWTDDSVRTALETLAQVWSNPDWILGGPSGALQASFPTDALKIAGDSPQAAIYYEGDFVGGVLASEAGAQPGVDIDFFDFPSIGGSGPAVVGGGDVAVMFNDTPAARALIQYLATPEAGEIWAALGGFSSPNKNVDLSVYPDDVSRRSAEALAAAEVFRFDLSDLTPAAFGGTAGQGMFQGLQNFLSDPSDIDGTMQYLEQQAAQAYGS
jgi:ABC-type glycerol-3-phosphate transport system substrate-binding protein